MIALCCAVLLVQQDPVRVVTQLPLDAAATVRRHLEIGVPDVALRFARLEALALAERWRAGEEIDVIAGVDAQLCELVAGSLAPRPRHAPSFWSDAQARFHVPWAAGWVAVSRRDAVEPPGVLDELADPSLAGRIAICGPRAAPSLWAGWLRQLAGLGRQEDQAMSLFAALDANVERYRPDPGAALAALELGDADLAFLPTDRLPKAEGAFEITAPDGAVPLAAYAIAQVAGSPREVAATRVFEALAAPELAAELADRHALFVAGRADYPGQLRDVFDRAAAYAPIEGATALAVLGRWEQHVQGRGAGLARLGIVIDVVLTILFFGAAWLVWRSVRSEERAEA